MWLGYETGFIGDWIIDDLTHLSFNWCYAFDKRIFDYFTLPNNFTSDTAAPIKFKFCLDPERKIVLNLIESGDLAILTVYEEFRNLESSHQNCTLNSRSLAIPLSRYIPFKNLGRDNIAASFRNLKELSIKIKENLFLPLRNEIYQVNALSPTPSINGLPECILFKIFKYLKRKDVLNLKCISRSQYHVYKAFVHNKKRKFE